MKTLTFALAVLVSGCSMTVHIPPEEAFTANPAFNDIQIAWISTDNPTAECKRLFPKTMAFHPVIAACAGWDWQTNTCTVVTGKPTTHQILGHEIRHCFEGKFHD
jgi:hypothetical protein